VAGSENFDTNPNWLSGLAPGYVGDTLIFAGNGGTAGLNPNMDNNYSPAGLLFTNGAGSFNISSPPAAL